MEKVLRRYFNGDRDWLHQNDHNHWTKIGINLSWGVICYFPIYQKFPAIEISIKDEKQAMKLLFLLGAFNHDRSE